MNKVYVTVALKNTLLVNKYMVEGVPGFTPIQLAKKLRKTMIATLNGEWKPSNLSYAVYEKRDHTFHLISKSDNFLPEV